MPNDSVRHDVAFVAAHALLEMACGLLLEWEKYEFRAEAYAIVLAALESYDNQIQRQEIKPSCN